MNKFIGGLAVLLSGLLFCCPKVYACDDILPKAGFQEFLDEIEIDPVDTSSESMHALPSYILTEEDEELVLKIAVLEAGGEDVEGMAQVIQVVMNRFDSENFPNSISGVIYQEGQFCTAKRLSKAEITSESREALNEVEWGNYKSNEALYFESCEGLVFADDYKYLFSYGGHDFYK